MSSTQAPAAKKARIEHQSRQQVDGQAAFLRMASTCSVYMCGAIFKDVVHVCSKCGKGVCDSCYQKGAASEHIPSNLCFFCRADENGATTMTQRTGGLLLEMAGAVVQKCAATGCAKTGTWAELDAHAPWCVGSTVECPICRDPVMRGNLKQHLVAEHGASLIPTKACRRLSLGDFDVMSESNNEGTEYVGVWEPDLSADNELRVACVGGSCRMECNVQTTPPGQMNMFCPCPFVIAMAMSTTRSSTAIPEPRHTHVAVSTVFAEIATLHHPMGHCEVAMRAVATADQSGALVSSRCTHSGAVCASSDGGLRCGLSVADHEGRTLHIGNAQVGSDGRVAVSLRFTPIAANTA